MVLSIALLFLVWQPLVFTIVYLCCGISDFADGFIARRFNAETAIGAKLDSLADFIFFAVNLIVLISLVCIENAVLVLLIVAAVAIVRGINLIVTRRKFRQWCVMHTVANKITGIALFISMPVCVWTGIIPLWLTIVVGIVAAISAVEELVILITTKTYDVNRKCFFSPTDRL